MDHAKIKEALGISSNVRIYVSKVSGGWNIRLASEQKINKSKHSPDSKSFTQILIDAGENPYICKRCQCKSTSKLHPHHIIPKSRGGRDDSYNGIFLCFNCHVGDDGIHNGKWDIEDLIPYHVLGELKARYD